MGSTLMKTKCHFMQRVFVQNGAVGEFGTTKENLSSSVVNK
jgi:hypothetical protein